ncbi:hypothetical protein BDV32DRAFT_106166 [Aspergillus pseudonomiae]|uniref:Uncharacterized protein n=1 Tax=Aspergillus pseudonomiae TaxID=1506151 RepID=A0A5N7D0L5_9EURO|nr:uncharacterized protein BDV37DRAFT_231199 [Aspergillus pseudonomiae]KAB8256023.1 hypothetical protein BDV32DRAFT_106166 [Aspergillus pseudonomiae]KAE8399398.1 hypothetical protein BDV37DRAFT_231199 [Aspergillus pseudonomiae]
MGTTSVRRNIFHHHLSKRSVPAALPNTSMQSGTNGGLTSLSSHVMPSASSESTQSLGPSIADGEEIVVKDKNGDYKLDIPVLPPAVGEDGDEMEGMEGGATRGSGPTGAESTAQTEISGHEKEKIEASLVEMMYRSRNRQMSSEPAEILNLIHQSLRNKVASLDEDNWIYEPEPDSLF